MNPLRILFVFGCPLKKGGTENVMINIVKNIDREMFHIDFLIFDKTTDTSDDKKYLKRSERAARERAGLAYS